MIKNYLKIAFRNLIKQRHFTFINIIGLAIGITASSLIFLWISYEKSYDKFHANYENIYRIVTKASLSGQNLEVCRAPSALAPKLMEVNPDVKNVARSTGYYNQLYSYQDNKIKEKRVISADSTFFQVFSFKFLEGNPLKPFDNLESVVLTKTAAKRYFGDEKALGKVLTVDNETAFTVSAVIDDLPSNSHMQFDVVHFLNMDDTWANINWFTYIVFADGFSEAKTLASLKEIVDNDILPVMTGFFGTTIEQFKNSGNFFKLDIQPLESIHLNSDYYAEYEKNGNNTYVVFFSIIAIFIIVVVGINYMNLSTAYYDTRVTEVGVRKANGATPRKLFNQFLFESLAISFIAFIVGFVLLRLMIPVFTNYLGLQINLILAKNIGFTALLFLIVIALGLISSIYPSIYLSHYKTASVLRNTHKSSGKSLFNLRSALVIVQFAITIIVIVASIMVKKQVGFMLEKDLGFNQEKLIVIEGANNLGDQKEAFKNELLQNPEIVSACFSDTYPGEGYNNITTIGIQGEGPEGQYVMKVIGATLDYFETYGMEMLQERDFDREDYTVMVVNENAAKFMQIDEDPLSHNILFNSSIRPVVGVVKNFHHDALNITLDPIAIRLVSNRNLNNITLRLSKGNNKETIKFIHEKWSEFSNNQPLDFCYLDEKLQTAYNAEMKVGKVFSIFSVLSVFIACMGIVGIASFLLQRRIKEIGIRKANGAKTTEILFLLNKQFVFWVVTAFIIASPIAFYAMHKWLQNFAYKTSFSWWIFALAGFVALAIAIISVSWQTIKASTRNPVEALRYE